MQGSRVPDIRTLGISATGDALAGSQPALCPKLNTDGGLLPLRWVQVIVEATGHDMRADEALLIPLPQYYAALAVLDVANTTPSRGSYNTTFTFLSSKLESVAVMPLGRVPPSGCHNPTSPPLPRFTSLRSLTPTHCCCYSLYMDSDLNIVLGTAVASLS